MDNLIKSVIEKFPNLNIEKQKAPSYVQIYTKTDCDVVLIFNKTKQYSNTTGVYDRNNRNEKDLAKDVNNELKQKRYQNKELELTGSPLKLDLSLHTVLDETIMTEEAQLWSKEEGLHGPLNIDMAREIATLYNANRGTDFEETKPLWILVNPSSPGKPLLISVQSDKDHFVRGIVSYEDCANMDDIDLDLLIEKYAVQEGLDVDMINTVLDCRFVISGVSYSGHSTEELVNAPHGGITELHCSWTTKTLHTPFISCKVNLEQEIIVGHLASPCNALWRSLCALHNMNQLLVDMTAAGLASVNLDTASIKMNIIGSKRYNNEKRVNELLNETETYAYTAEYPPGGCVCVTEDTTSLGQCLKYINCVGSSNDFTYKLWDILRDCETAEELITLLIQALKFISSGRIRPFIDANNKTYLSKLVLKLSRGHSQASKVLKNLRSSPPQALSLVAQVGTEKTMWEYTRIMSLLEHSFFIAGIWNTDARTHESIEQINQTINDMTMSGGDFTLNPFESLSNPEHSIRLDCESFYEDDPNELTVDDFASLKKHGVGSEKKDMNEVPLITDEIDISPWKNLLMKFSQVHVCLEHLYRAETCLRVDFASLKPITARLLETFVSDKSPIRTVGQLMSDPVQKISMPIANNIVQDHLKKPAFWYRAEMTRKETTASKGIQRDLKMVYVFSQLPVFPPAVWQNLEPQSEEIAEVTTIGEELRYHTTKYVFISNKLASKLPL